MKELTRNATALVVFWTLHQRKHHADKRYHKTKMATEFPWDESPEKAIESIYKEHGRVTDVTSSGNPCLEHAIISSHAIISPHERGQIESWKATQEPLFDGMSWQACTSYKPGR